MVGWTIQPVAHHLLAQRAELTRRRRACRLTRHRPLTRRRIAVSAVAPRAKSADLPDHLAGADQAHQRRRAEGRADSGDRPDPKARRSRSDRPPASAADPCSTCSGRSAAATRSRPVAGHRKQRSERLPIRRLPCGTSTYLPLALSSTFWLTCARIGPGKSELIPLPSREGQHAPGGVRATVRS